MKSTFNGRRVVITGLGLISPVGNTVADSWRAMLEGTSGIAQATQLDLTNFPATIAGEVKGFDVEQYITAREARRLDPFAHYGVAACLQAFDDANLEVTEDNAERIGICFGSGIGGLTGIEAIGVTVKEQGPRKVSPFHIPSTMINAVAGQVSIMKGLKGPNMATVTACTTSTHAIGVGARMINYGDADVLLCGGSEFALTGGAMGGFGRAQALSTRNDAPQAASRPWDVDRDGFVLANGGGCMVLEEYEHAKARGATIYAELTGFGMSGDAFHMTSPSENGDGAKRCMENAITDAGLNIDDIDYINAHGTSTPAGDVAETQAVQGCFGDHAKQLAVSSTKSMTGHLLGAAGVLEAIATTLAIRDQVAPPTINLDNPDPNCTLDYVPHTARDMTIRHAISNSFGFGGTNGSLIFSKLD